MSKLKRRRAQPDSLDQTILATLQRDGRISKIQLAAEIGLSTTSCWERMQRLEAERYIRGYHADIDLKKLAGLSFFLVQVTLADSSVARARHFERVVSGCDEVLSCQAVLGTVDYFLMIAAQGVDSYQRVIERLSSQDTVQFEFVTFPISKTVKSPQSVPLQALLATKA